MSYKKVYAADSTASVERVELKVNEKNIDMRRFFPRGFRGKFMLNVEEVDGLQQSNISLKKNLTLEMEDDISSGINIELKTADNKINSFYDECISITSLGSKKLFIFSSVDVPYVAKGNVPESKKDFVEMAKVFNLYVVITDKVKSDFVKGSFEVFDAYGALGFAILDVSEFDDFISKKIRSNDLIEEFTTTEIASELFEEGLMVLSWGHTPWVYYIDSKKYEDVEDLIGDYTGYNGLYKLKGGGRKCCIIPGNELQDWNACKNKIWPLIEINGMGEYVTLKLYIKNALSQSDRNYPVPTFHIERIDGENMNLEPLLQSNILIN